MRRVHPRIGADPSRVRSPSGTEHYPARAFLFADEDHGGEVVLIVVGVVARKAAIVATEIVLSVAEAEGSASRDPHRITTAEGVWSCWSSGCGCGSPIKRFGPGEAAALYEKARQEVPA